MEASRKRSRSKTLPLAVPPQQALAVRGELRSCNEEVRDNFNAIEKGDLLQVYGFDDKKAQMVMNAFALHGSFDSYDAVKRHCYGIGNKHVALLKAFGWQRCEPVHAA